jgi:glycosyltransferase involved in cell wall biosynthesis
LVTRILLALAARRIDFSFRMYGVDDRNKVAGMLRKLEGAGVDIATFPRMAYKRFLRSLSEVAVGLAPLSLDTSFNQGKSFGKVLAYLVCDVAVVASPSLEHPKFFRNGQNGMLPQTPDEWIDCTTQLLNDPPGRQAITDQAWKDLQDELSTETATKRVMRILEDVISALSLDRPPVADPRRVF